MHKLINRIALIVVAIAVGLYFVQGKINSPEECQKIAGVWNETDETCEQTTPQKIYDSLSANYPLSMNYPEKNIVLQLDKEEIVEGVHYLRGNYQKVLQEASGDQEALYDRGILYLNMSNMLLLNETEKGLIHFAAPFIVNTVGTGVFVYVGLFSYDMQTKSSVHLDSAFLGDRIREEKMTYIKDYLQVDFKDYSEQQARSDYPDKATAIYLQLANDFSHFNIVKRMHNSWDANKDGINDCELDGSCDHTINYSAPRIEKVIAN